MKWADDECTRHFAIIIFMSYCDFQRTPTRQLPLSVYGVEAATSTTMRFSIHCFFSPPWMRDSYDDTNIKAQTGMLFLYFVQQQHAIAGADNSIVRNKQKAENRRIINENIRTNNSVWICLQVASSSLFGEWSGVRWTTLNFWWMHEILILRKDRGSLLIN